MCVPFLLFFFSLHVFLVGLLNGTYNEQTKYIFVISCQCLVSSFIFAVMNWYTEKSTHQDPKSSNHLVDADATVGPGFKEGRQGEGF